MPSDERHRALGRVLPFPTHRTLATTGEHRAMQHRYPVPIRFGARDAADLPTPFPPRRATGSAASFKEQMAMNSLDFTTGTHFAHAEYRRQEMMAEAEQARRLNAIDRAPRRAFGIAALRRQVGAALVSAGHRLQGAGSPATAAEQVDSLPAVGNLRVVR